VTPGQIHPALRVLMGNPSERELAEFLRLCMARHINLNDIRVVVDSGGRIQWTVLPVVHPGRTAMLFTPPAPQNQACHAAAREALRQMAGELGGRGVALAQVLLEPSDSHLRVLLESAGFTAISELLYLQGAVNRRAAPPDLPAGFSWLTYLPRTHGLFARAIAGSYEGSLDCPALNGRRDIEDIIAGHRSTGAFDPRHWMLLCRSEPGEDQSPLGVVLLNRTPGTETMELVYLGLVQEARGRQLGQILMRQAMATAGSAGCTNMALAVDAANDPALRLYHQHGLEYLSSRLVVVRDLRSGAAPLRELTRRHDASTHSPQVQ
jgi:mycothiol synthase